MHPKYGSVLLAGAMVLTTATTMAAQNAASTTPRSARVSHSVEGAQANSSLDVAFTYDATLSDVITSSRFAMQGGSLQIHGRFYGGWGAVADVAGAHTANIDSTAVGLNLVTATFGPRYTWSPPHARYSIFGQGLVGEAFGLDSTFPNPSGAMSSANGLAIKVGGGMNCNLSPRIALRVFEADYLRTQLPNSTNDVQNNVRLGAGLVLRFR